MVDKYVSTSKCSWKENFSYRTYRKVRPLNISDFLDVHIIPCAEPPANSSTLLDLFKFAKIYHSVTPGVFFPNWSFGSHAVCALLCKTDAERLRVIGTAHADHKSYYDLLSYYEPIIQRFIAVSDEIAIKLSKIIPQRQNDIVVRPYPVEVPDRLSKKYSEQYEPLRIVYAGRIDIPQKRPQDLVKLIKILDSLHVDYQFRIIGDGNYKENLLSKLSNLEVHTKNRVRVQRTVSPNKMPDVWNTCDIFILVSEFEGTSIAMLEAMAHGCVPVVTRVSGTSKCY